MKGLFFRHRGQSSSGAHPASCQIDTVSSFPGLKRPRREADRSPSPNGAKDVDAWRSTSLSCVIMACYLQLYLYLFLSQITVGYITGTVMNKKEGVTREGVQLVHFCVLCVLLILEVTWANFISY
jgi:hypothetical protein